MTANFAAGICAAVGTVLFFGGLVFSLPSRYGRRRGRFASGMNPTEARVIGAGVALWVAAVILTVLAD